MKERFRLNKVPHSRNDISRGFTNKTSEKESHFTPILEDGLSTLVPENSNNQGMNSDIYGRLALDICTVFMILISSLYESLNKTLVANGLGLLVRIVTVGDLQSLDQLDVFGLSLGGGETLVDDLLPGALLGLALF